MYFEWHNIREEYPSIVPSDNGYPKLQKFAVVLKQPTTCYGKYNIRMSLFTDHFCEIENENKILYWAMIPLPDELIVDNQDDTEDNKPKVTFNPADICASCKIRYVCDEFLEFKCNQKGHMYYSRG